MYLLNCDPLKKKRLSEEVMSNEDLLSVYKALRDDAYDIFFKVNREENKVTYYAIRKGEGSPHYLSFSIDGNKDIHNDFSSFSKENPCSEAFALFVLESDNDASVEKLKERYGESFSSLYPLAKLKVDEAKKFLKAKTSLDSLKKDLLSSFFIEEKKKIKISYSIAEDRGDRYSLELIASISRNVPIKNLPSFFSSLLANEPIVLGGKDGVVTQYEIEETDRVSLAFLSSRLSFLYGDDIGYLKEDTLVSFLFLMKKRSIILEGQTYLIRDVVSSSISIDDSGKIVLSRPLKQGEKALYCKNRCAIFEPIKKEISLLSFSTDNEAKLASFASSHQDFPYELVSEELGKSIVPLLGKNTKVSDAFLASKEKEIATISYSISYTEEDSLECITSFSLAHKEIDEDAFCRVSDINSARLERFKGELEKLSLPMNGALSNQDTILSFLHADLKSLGDSCKLFLSDNLVKSSLHPLSPIKIATKSGEDWFSLSLESDKYSKEELEEIFASIKKHKKFIHLHGNFIVLDEAETLLPLVNEFKEEDLGKKLPVYQVFKFANFYKGELSLTEALGKMIRDIASYQDVSLASLNPSLKGILRPYQADGVRWLLIHDKYELGGILADEMGLGKTLETIAFLSMSQQEEPILIVSPKSLVYNWESEFKRFDPSREVVIIEGNASDRDKIILKMKSSKKTVFVVSYDSLRNDIDKIKEIDFSYVFLDEGQFIANAFAKKSKAVKEIRAKHRYVLTGTPIQNSLLDLWSIFDFLMPGYFPSYKDFKLEYGGFEYADINSERRLRYRIEPFFLKRTKKDVLKELPPKEEKVVMIALNEEQRKLYESYLRKARELLKGTKEKKESSELDRKTNKLVVLSALTRLREICVDPSMFLEGEVNSEKIIALIDSINSATKNGHKVLVFSSFKKALSHIETLLSSLGIKSYFIYGDTSAKERLRMAEAFNTLPETKVMLVSLKAGGTGLNLVGADLVYHLDPWWNVASEEQASDRAHRLGQKRKVTIYKLIAKNTVEEKVIELQNKKKNLSLILESDEENSFRKLSDEDIAFLLS